MIEPASSSACSAVNGAESTNSVRPVNTSTMPDRTEPSGATRNARTPTAATTPSAATATANPKNRHCAACCRASTTAGCAPAATAAVNAATLPANTLADCQIPVATEAPFAVLIN